MPRLPAALALLATLACVPPPQPLPFAPAGPDAAPAPSRRGPFPVGVRTMVLEDPSRRDEAGASVPVIVEVWYPANEDARGLPGRVYDIGEYLDAAQRESVASLGVALPDSGAVPDVPPRHDQGPFPLVVFSHGKAALRWQSTYLTVTLASHGYVVVAPDHTGDTLREALGDDFDLTRNLFGTAMTERPADVRLVLDTFVEPAEGHFLRGVVDAQHVGIAGHSFGGFTALRMAALDDRIDVAVPLAPPTVELAWVDLGLEYSMNKPVLMQAAHNDQTLEWNENIEPTWARLSRPRALLDVPLGGHFTFSDICSLDLASLAERIGFVDLGGVLDDGCSAPAPTTAEAHPVLNHFAIGFLNGHLRASPGSLALLDQAHADALAPGVATYLSDF
jgi:predicted dienelactone hydrolase